jgi:hypothetical protein
MQRLLPIFNQLERDGYYTINGIRCQRRLAANASHLTAIFADIDSCHQADASAERIAERVAADWKQLEQLFVVGRLPFPSGVAFSGRGIWLFYALAGDDGQAIPATRESIVQWKAEEDALIDRLKTAGLPVDPAARDLARITRMPGSINSNAERRVKQAWTTKDGAVLAYSLAQLSAWFGITTEERQFYTNTVAFEPQQRRGADRPTDPIKRRGYEALCSRRGADMEKLSRIRNGFGANTCRWLATWIYGCHTSPQAAARYAVEFCRPPLTPAEVMRLSRRVRLYRFQDCTIGRLLKITPEENRQLQGDYLSRPKPRVVGVKRGIVARRAFLDDAIKRGEATSVRQLSTLARAAGYKASFETVRRDVLEMRVSLRCIGPNLFEAALPSD